MLPKDSITRLCHSTHLNKGVFALLLGSGVSRGAQIPTGWEITLGLIARLAEMQGIERQDDWVAWYQEQTGQQPDYSEIMEQVAKSPVERRSILQAFIEPSAEESEQGIKTPTSAHHAIAALVKSGHLRVIITTNFDRLIENALRDVGVEPTIVSSEDDLVGAQPFHQCRCFLLKLHGDYLDDRILNTEAELGQYPSKITKLLDRIFDEHGLVICGWSGEWDPALVKALRKAPNRRYPTFWAARSNPTGTAQSLCNKRDSDVITITDADVFFKQYSDTVHALDNHGEQDVIDLQQLVARTKRYLSEPDSHRIALTDLLAGEVRRYEAASYFQDYMLAPDTSSSEVLDEFHRRVRIYEASMERILAMAMLCARWGDGKLDGDFLVTLGSLYQAGRNNGAGTNVLLELRLYPATLLFTAYGLGLVAAGNLERLYCFFAHLIYFDRTNQVDIEAAHKCYLLWGKEIAGNEFWNALVGPETYKTALSDYLFNKFGDWSYGMLGITENFASLYEEFEILASLAWSNCKTHEELDPNGWYFICHGREAWDREISNPILRRVKSEEFSDNLLKVGFCHGNRDRYENVIRALERSYQYTNRPR